MGDVKAVAEPHLVSHRLATERLSALLSLDDVQVSGSGCRQHDNIIDQRF